MTTVAIATQTLPRVALGFDPEQSIRDYEAGPALDDLVRRPPLPPGTSPMDMRPERPRA